MGGAAAAADDIDWGDRGAGGNGGGSWIGPGCCLLDISLSLLTSMCRCRGDRGELDMLMSLKAQAPLVCRELRNPH